MPNMPSMSIPREAADKAEEKVKGGVDYYADLTDEEREEEGLPPRDEALEAPAPAQRRPAEPVDDEPEGDGSDDVEKVLSEIADLREDIRSALGKPDPAPSKKDEDPLMEAALDHEDETIRGLAERLQQAESKLANVEARDVKARNDAQMVADNKAFSDVQSSYTIGGKPMTDEHIEQVERFILQNPEVGSRLSIEALTRVVFPDAVKSGRKSAPANGPADIVPGEGPKVATIIDTGAGAGGGGGRPAKFTPRQNESIESAMKQYAADRGLKR